MAENYEEKKTYYIPAHVEQIQELGNYPVKVSFRIGEERCAVQFEDSPALLFTAEEVARANGMYTTPPRPRDEVVAENRELKAKVASLQEENERLSSEKGQVKHWRGMYTHMKARCDEYKKAADHLKEERDRTDDELALTRIMNVALAEKIERLQNNG